MKNIIRILLIVHTGFSISEATAQSLLDSCYTSATPAPTFTGTTTLANSADADLLEWTGASWNGAWPNANITLPPPCNTPPVRAIWIGDSSVWTTGGEAFGLKFSPPLVAGNGYHFFFTYVSTGMGSNGAFSPSVYTNATGSATGNYVGDLIPAGYAWESHQFSFTATPAQAGDEYLIIHSFNGSGMVLNLCAETITDLGDDSLTVCIGDSAILFAGNGFQSYSWSTGETTQHIVVQSSGTYISTNQGFCGTSSDTIVVTMDPCGMFPIAVFSNPNNHICPGTCTDFINLSQNATSYVWSFSGATPSTSSDENPSTICYNTPGTYSVQLVATNAITSDTLILNNFITVYPYPSPQGIMQSGDTLFANQGSVSYQWYFNGTPIPGATEYFYVAQEGGDYNIVATDGNGCEVEAAIFDVIAGIESAGDNSLPIAIYPNPVEDRITIRIAGSKIETAGVVSVYNVTGEKLFSIQTDPVNKDDITLDVSALSSGLYCVEVTGNSKPMHGRFMKSSNQ